MWEHFRHQADIGVRGIGGSLDAAFAEGGLALMAVMCDPDKVDQGREVQIECEAVDIELLFADWLNTIIYEIAVKSLLFGRFEVRITKNKLSAKAWGEKVDTEKHDTIVEVKAATYSQLKVEQGADGKWMCQCVVDV